MCKYRTKGLSVNRINSVSGTAVVAEPTATPYNGEVEDRNLDYMDPETGEMKTSIVYYALKEPEKNRSSSTFLISRSIQAAPIILMELIS